MKNDRSKAPRDSRFPFSLVGRMAKRWEGGAERFLSELNARGETRLEELSRKMRQTEVWLRIREAAEKAETRREAVRASWGRAGAELLGRAGIPTDARFESLEEEVRRLSWRIDRMSKKLQENQLDEDVGVDPDSDFRSLA